MMNYIALGQHVIENTDPIIFQKGTYLNIGEKYQGVENWNDWYFCQTNNHSGGWVPKQIIHRIDLNYGIALEDYNATELAVKYGDEVIAIKFLNGWVWCRRIFDYKEGWVPENLLIITTNKKI